ncbi:uncharacterized protein L3040_003512 [Drepanopeziza brunnea f. sp. 'multigermtubi']|uniref:Putative DUF6 domain protein n=1 Tax=Marssonina brunnea f. sp. multigermtubi (strain MB_m1) TaxID=1072389 RepID=K1WUE9_MARBU|nr:putative DUF6 domain protein [Drepanopeziza brunnea f. sp. 'multigermtubi' MB_m1]EKD16077.1 putative DUF6 domain protein [Drepanopeziza brunnea f. sp. 'multigermtubi' MB_m1]KAJ5047693.1 hypothetical protein L3040_003512 [Drepanopeziza brunnea f. sp. 'multigermtubi']
MARQNSTSEVRDENESAGIEPIPGLWSRVWKDNKGAIYILISELFGTSTDAIVRGLQQGRGGNGMHPFQVIIARLGVTFVLSALYMWWKEVPDFPLGNRAVRGWLVLRAVFGFFGLFCLYYSVHYIPLAESTVIRFLVPIVTAWACSIALGQRFLRKDLVAGLVALVGVIIIAHPESIFGKVDDAIGVTKPGQIDHVTPAQRLIAITVALLGVLGASGAYTTIRIIGPRAHALMTVNYFAFLGTAASTVALLVIPGIGFVMPNGAREWLLLLALGVLGFGLQFLLTAGLQMDRSSKATSMLYTQILFALGFDWAIWGVIPGRWSLLGGMIVVVSTFWSALQPPPKPSDEDKTVAVVDEETALLGAQIESSGAQAQRRQDING